LRKEEIKMSKPESLSVENVRYIREDLVPNAVTYKAPPLDLPDTQFINKNVFVRTVTMNYTGKLVAVTGGRIVLEDAAWIADSGRFSEALKTSVLVEVEPYPFNPLILSLEGSEISPWNHALPRTVK
jgi:hypothetical protein